MAESDAFNFDAQTAKRLLAMLTAFESSHEFVFWKPPVPGVRTESQRRWGKLDAELAAGESGTVSLWQTTDGGWEGWDEDSGANWDDCYLPPTPIATLPTDTLVLVCVVNGRRVILDFQRSQWGKLDGSLSVGGSATVSIWAGDPLADTGDNVTAHDWLLETGDSLDAETKVKIEFISTKWYVTATPCA